MAARPEREGREDDEYAELVRELENSDGPRVPEARLAGLELRPRIAHDELVERRNERPRVNPVEEGLADAWVVAPRRHARLNCREAEVERCTQRHQYAEHWEMVAPYLAGLPAPRKRHDADRAADQVEAVGHNYRRLCPRLAWQ